MNMGTRFLPMVLAASAVFLFAAHRLDATPNFMRKLGNPADGCHACHTVMPRLNEFGYKFRAAGYRIPNQIGESETKPFEFGDIFSGGIIANYNVSRAETGSTITKNNQFNVSDIEFFPITGAFSGHYATKVELDFSPKGEVNFNTAYMRYTGGHGDRYWGVRVGVLSAEGYGASDRGIGLQGPYFTGAANYNQTQFFTLGLTSAAAEAGVDYQRTSLRVSILNGGVLINDGGTLKLYGSQGGALAKPAGAVTSSTPDFQVYANQILTSNGGGVSVLYYHGNLGVPYLGTTNRFYKNKFDRVVLYGSYPVYRYLMLLGGFERGQDHLETGTAFWSGGFFGSAEVPIGQNASLGVRYDFFDPARNKADNEVKGVSTFATLFTNSGMRVTAEFQHKDTIRGTSPHRYDNGFTTRIAYYR